MSYPLSESFATAPATGYTQSWAECPRPQQRAAIHRHLGSQQPVHLRFKRAAHGDFWFEADVELLTDPSAPANIGLWMTTAMVLKATGSAHLRRRPGAFPLEQRFR